MPIYVLKDSTYEIFPREESEKKEPDITPGQLRTLAMNLSEYFGCFMLFGMSYQGEPRFLATTSSGMEHLALKKFAEDVVLGEVGVELSTLDEDDDFDE